MKLTLGINKPRFSDFASIGIDFCWGGVMAKAVCCLPTGSHVARASRKPGLRFWMPHHQVFVGLVAMPGTEMPCECPGTAKTHWAQQDGSPAAGRSYRRGTISKRHLRVRQQLSNSCQDCNAGHRDVNFYSHTCTPMSPFLM